MHARCFLLFQLGVEPLGLRLGGVLRQQPRIARLRQVAVGFLQLRGQLLLLGLRIGELPFDAGHAVLQCRSNGLQLQ